MNDFLGLVKTISFDLLDLGEKVARVTVLNNPASGGFSAVWLPMK